MLNHAQSELLALLRETPRPFEDLSPSEQQILGSTLRPGGDGFDEEQLALIAAWRLIINQTQLEAITQMLDPGQGLDPVETLPLGEAMAAKLHGLGFLPSADPEQTVLTLPSGLLTDIRPGDNWFNCAPILRTLPLVELGEDFFPTLSLD